MIVAEVEEPSMAEPLGAVGLVNSMAPTIPLAKFDVTADVVAPFLVLYTLTRYTLPLS